MRINEDVLRFMTIRVEEHEEGPSAMMQKRDRDERRERERFGGGFGGGGFGGGGRFATADRGDRGDRPRRDRPREAEADAPAATEER